MAIIYEVLPACRRFLLKMVPQTRFRRTRAAVGQRVASGSCLFPGEFQRDTAAGFSVTLCMCTGSSLQPTLLDLISVQLLPSVLSVSGPRVQGAAGCWTGALLWSAFDLVRLSGAEGKEGMRVAHVKKM